MSYKRNILQDCNCSLNQFKPPGSVPKLGGTASPLDTSCSTNITQSIRPVYSCTLHCNYLPLVVWHKAFSISPVGSGVAWPASDCSEPSVWMKGSILHAPCEICQNSDHKWPAGNPACLLPDTIGLLEADQCIDCEYLCNSLWKQVSVRGHYCERYIACLSGKQKTDFKFDRANRDWQWRGYKLVWMEQGFPLQTPKFLEILKRQGANC